MQPNQQDSYPQDGPSAGPQSQDGSQPYAVPEYLHLDPVPDPIVEKHKKKKTKLVIVIAILFVVLIAGGAMLIYWLQGATERKFYDALDKTMQVSYVARNFNSTAPGITISTAAKTDFSDTKTPKSQFDYVFSQSVQNDKTKTTIGVKGSEVVAANDMFFARLSEVYPDFSGNPMLNKWIKVPDTDTSLSNTYDPLHLHTPLATFSGEVLVGNFDQQTRRQLIDFMRANAVYTLQSTKQTTVGNGKPATEYTVTINQQKLVDLNKKAASLLGVDASYDVSANNVSKKIYKILIDDNTDKLVKMTFSDQDASAKNAVSGMIEYTYPEKVNVDIPTV